ncbi:HVA22-like protein e [Telopea speciosissima]|uniref:HVA22-like protein e n=1 Tax=Telopea speciosissima TaxID=54955 RepID=UPI001CC46058|nr:HVA22-like protein e [Telopea speciosissima]
MGRFWTSVTYLHSLAGPAVMLVYPLYASVMAMESTSKVDDEQWLAYWILYSFLTLLEMLLQPLLQWIPIWYDIKLVFVAWLVLPQFRGAAFIYDRFVREKLRRVGVATKPRSASAAATASSPSKGKDKNKFVDFISPKKGGQEAY